MRKWGLLLSVGCVSLGLAARPSLAVPILSVDVDPLTPGIQSSGSIALGVSATIDVVITDVTDLHDFELDLDFAPAILGATMVVGGPFLPTPLTIESDITAPDVNFAQVSLLPLTGASGSGVLASVTFDTLSGGTSFLSLNDVILAAPLGLPIFLSPDDVVGGSLRVVGTAIPEPATALLLGLGLLALASSRRRR